MFNRFRCRYLLIIICALFYFLIILFYFLFYILLFRILCSNHVLHAYLFYHFIACVNLCVFSGLCLKCSRSYWVFYILTVQSFALFLRYVYLPTYPYSSPYLSCGYILDITFITCLSFHFIYYNWNTVLKLFAYFNSLWIHRCNFIY